MTDDLRAEIAAIREEIATATAQLTVTQALEGLRELVECRCNPAWADRGIHEPHCTSDYRAEVEALTAAIERVEALAEEWEADITWREWGIGRRVRFALEGSS